MSDLFVKTTPPLLDDLEELQLALVRMQQERDAWKNKFQTLESSYREDLKEKDDLIEILESRAVESMERQGIYFLLSLKQVLITHFLLQMIGKRLPSDRWNKTRG